MMSTDAAMTTSDWILLSILLSIGGYVAAAYAFYKKVYTVPAPAKHAK